jgi:CheY-like chemotaxis protein
MGWWASPNIKPFDRILVSLRDDRYRTFALTSFASLPSVLTDIDMPRKTGLEASSDIRAYEAKLKLPPAVIVAVSAIKDEAAIARGKNELVILPRSTFRSLMFAPTADRCQIDDWLVKVRLTLVTRSPFHTAHLTSSCCTAFGHQDLDREDQTTIRHPQVAPLELQRTLTMIRADSTECSTRGFALLRIYHTSESISS